MERIHQQIRDNFEKAFFDLLKQEVVDLIMIGLLDYIQK